MPASKSDQIQKAKRVQQAVKSILDGYGTQEVSLAMQEQYGVSEAQAYRYVKEATEKIYEKIEGSLEEKINQHYKRLELLYRRCVQDGDKRTARMVLKDISELVGLDAPKRTDITSGGEKLATFVDILGVEEGSDAKTETKPTDENMQELSDTPSDGEQE